MLIATPHDEIVKPKAYKVTLRDGRDFIVGGMSASTLKFMRKNGGMLSIKNTVNGEEVNVSGKMIKTISPVSA